MNRIQNLVDDELDSLLSSAAETARGSLDADGPSDLAHCIFTPLHYERNYAYPLVVWLHGPGDDERQVTRVMPLVSMRNYVAVGPRGTAAAADAEGGCCWRQQPRDIALAEQGVASAEDIDKAMELGYNHPMGPLRLTDLVGLDVRLSIADYLHSKLGSETFRAPKILRRKVAEGKLGKKSGEGFYKW